MVTICCGSTTCTNFKIYWGDKDADRRDLFNISRTSENVQIFRHLNSTYYLQKIKERF